MVELGQLEAQHEKFDSRGVRVVAVSLDGPEDAALTQRKFPHLTIVADKEGNLARTADVIGPLKAPDGTDTVSPTTVLIDRGGRVRWVYRPERFLNRLSAAELLAAVDAHLRGDS